VVPFGAFYYTRWVNSIHIARFQRVKGSHFNMSLEVKAENRRFVLADKSALTISSTSARTARST
jgi:hypothetical protein